MEKNLLLIYGSGGHATSTYNLAKDLNLEVEYFIDPFTSLDSKFGIKILDHYEFTSDQKFVVIAIGDNKLREQIYISLLKYSNLVFPKLIHPTAYVSKLSKISEGTVVMQGASIGPNCDIGSFCIINSAASVDHDCRIEDFSSLSPSVTLAGSVHIGLGSTIYMNSAIADGVSIGKNSVIGACSFVKDDVGNGEISYGTPSRSR
jgi:sugar O-acyltransferase (sialic acid O-acetyltransferase NeuD family)